MIKTFDSDSYKISYKSQGSGCDILLLHGFPSNIYMWDDIVKELLAKNYRVTTVEQRGYPLSMSNSMIHDDFTIDKLSRDIEILIKTLDLSNNITLVGHDWGTVVAWAILKRNIVKIENILSICGGTLFPSTDVYSTLRYDDGEHYITSFQKPRDASNLLNEDINNSLLGAYRTKNKEPNTNLSIRSLFNDLNHTEYALDESQIDILSKHFEKHGFYGPISWYANLDKNIKLSKEWTDNHVSQQVTFLFGEKDIAVSLNQKMIERLGKVADLVKIREISGAGHWLPYTHKESVLHEIYSFYKD
jgi:soluble epoxide hydrolase/lipid-phosphate phosphatase